MDFMFWVWLAVLIVTAIVEFATMEIASIWFTVGAIIPFIMAATNRVAWWIQVVVFVVISAVLIISLRGVTKRFLLRNSNHKTNVDSLIGQRHRMLERTDFETMGSVKINAVIWSALGEKGQTIEKGEIVEIVKIDGNKLIVKKIEEEKSEPEVLTEVKKTLKKEEKTEKKPTKSVQNAKNSVSNKEKSEKTTSVQKKKTTNKGGNK